MPYFYLYDTYTSDRVHANTLVRIENTLTDLGIQGRITKLTILKSARDLVEMAIKDGADTIVAVGNDLTVSKVVSALIGKKTSVVLGIIPLGSKDQRLTQLLGIPPGVLACHVLSSRIIEALDVGKVNNQYFIRSVEISGAPNINCDNQYSIQFTGPHKIKVCNLDSWQINNNFITSDPKNGLLEIILEPQIQKGFWAFQKQKQSLSRFNVNNCIITTSGDSLPVIVDGEKVIKTPVTLNTANYKVKTIVGKKRLV